jgi:hypothetical protein
MAGENAVPSHLLDEPIVKELSERFRRPREVIAAVYAEELESLSSHARVQGFVPLIAARKTYEVFLHHGR